MPINVIDEQTLKAQRRQGDHQVYWDFGVRGRNVRMRVDIAHGEIRNRPLLRPGTSLRDYLGPRAHLDGPQPATGELLTTPPYLQLYVQKTIIDLQVGREDVPLVYQPLYRTMTDAGFPEMVNIAPVVNHASVMFLDHIEGEEVVFGAREMGPGAAVQIYTYTAGFEWTEDMIEFDSTWRATMASEGFGRGYNALLNHIHLGPIIGYNPNGLSPIPWQTGGDYPDKNVTDGTAIDFDALGVENPSPRTQVRFAIRQGLIDANSDENTDSQLARQPSILLANPVDRWLIEDALGSYVENNTAFPAVTDITTMIFYRGYNLKVGSKSFNYWPVPRGICYLIDPSTYFMELVKHDLRIDAFEGDMSRLIAQQVIARTRRGVFAAPAEAVQKVILPIASEETRRSAPGRQPTQGGAQTAQPAGQPARSAGA